MHAPRWTRTRLAVLAAVSISVSVATADEPAAPRAAATPRGAVEAMGAAEREAVALAFVREHDPELAGLVASLKAMRPAQYDKAIRELAQESVALARLKGRDPARYDLGLGLWKARSRVDLLRARHAASGPAAAAELESQLRQAIAALIDWETRQARYERDQLDARLKRLDANLRRLEADPAALAESRLQAALKKSRRAGPARPGPGAAANANANANANVNGSPTPNPKSTGTARQGDRP